MEPPAEIAGGGGIGDPLCPQGVEVDLVVASQLEMLERVSSGQDVEGDVQHVIELMVRQVTLEEVETTVDVADQSGLAGHQQHGANAARGQPRTRPASSYWMLLAVIIGRSRFGPGRFSMRLSIPRLRCRSLLSTLGFTRKPPLLGVVRTR